MDDEPMKVEANRQEWGAIIAAPDVFDGPTAEQPKKPSDSDRIYAAYDRLAAARTDLYRADRHAVNCKHQADDLRCLLLSSGTVTGKNADEREASLRSQMAATLQAVRAAENDLAAARLELDLAQQAIDEIKTQLRLREIMLGERGELPY